MTSPITPSRLISVITPSSLKLCFNMTLPNLPTKKEDATPNLNMKTNFSKDSHYTLTETTSTTTRKAPIIAVSSKPTLNTLSSRNKLYEYSQSKRYLEDQLEFSVASKAKPINEQPISEYDELIEWQKNHLPVPLEKKNDEKFKILKMKQMKRMSVPMNKSVKKYEDILPEYEKSFKNVLDYSAIKKKKVSHSTRKIYTSTLTCYNSKRKEVMFPLFTDSDIGIYEYWQAHIIDSKADEDVETDNEQLSIAGSYVIGEIKEAFDALRKDGADALVNFNRFGDNEEEEYYEEE